MSGNGTRGLCALAAGTALAAFTLVTAGAAGAAPGSRMVPGRSRDRAPGRCPGFAAMGEALQRTGQQLRRGLRGEFGAKDSPDADRIMHGMLKTDAATRSWLPTSPAP